MGPGENAGAVSVGDGWAVAFKVESHNHPSAVEPFQGAATGVGGHPARRLRARRSADRDPRLAALRRSRLRALAVPVRARRRRDRPLRQLDRRADRRRRGLLRGSLRAELPRQRDVRRPRPRRCDGPLRGGRGRQRRRPDGRVDRPRRDRRRLGARLRRARGGRRLEAPDRPDRRPVRGVEAARVLPRAARARACWSSLQDLGAAGLTSSAGEMASAGGVGIDIDVGRVPLREADMEPFEIMVSESQERMLAVVEPARVDEVLALCERWETGAAVIGEVTDGGGFRVLRDGELVGEMPVAALVDGCPLYDLEPAEPAQWGYANRDVIGARVALDVGRGADPAPGRRSCSPCSPRRASPRKSWAFEQYDSVVRLAHRPPARRPPTRRSCSCPRPARRSRSRSTATGGGSRATRTRARSRRCSSARRTSPASAPSRSGSPTASTSAIPRSRPSPGSSTARRRASPTPARRSASRSSAATSRSTTRPRTARSTRRPVVGMVGELPDAAPSGWIALADGDAIAVWSGRSRPRSPGRSWRSCAASSGPGLPSLPIERGARRDRARPRSRPRRCSSAPPTTSATAASPARSPRWRSPAASGSTRGPRRAGRGPRLLGRDGAVRRGAGRVRARRSARRARAAGRATDRVDVLIVGKAGGDADRDLGRRGRGRRARSPTPAAPGVRSATGSRAPLRSSADARW